jgi:hypothetical protein
VETTLSEKGKVEKRYRMFSDAAQAATLMGSAIPVAGAGGGL